MRTKKTLRGEAATLIIIGIAAVGLVTWLFAPKILDGDSRRADDAKATTAMVQEAVSKAVAAEEKKSAVAAASLDRIEFAATTLPPSPEKEFISRESDLAQTLLPKPDYEALLAAERRRVAIMEGELIKANELYVSAYEDNKKHLERAVKAEKAYAEAIAEKTKSDDKLVIAAAEKLAMERQRNQLFFGLLVLIVGGIILRFYLISPSSMGKMVAAIRSGDDPIQAIDTYLAPHLMSTVRKAAKLATEPDDK